jgi:hypothetical protein
MRSAVAASSVGLATGDGILLNAPAGRSAEKMSMGTSTNTGPGRPA